MALHFHAADTDFKLKGKNSVRRWVHSELLLLGFKPGQVNIIFCSDDYLLEINKKYLNHNYYTDIITFNYNKGNIISGDLFISVDRTKENAETFNTDFYQEILRVIIHGILHLTGYNDHLPHLKEEIRNKEDLALKRFPFMLE